MHYKKRAKLLYVPSNFNVVTWMMGRGYSLRKINSHQDKFRHFVHSVATQAVLFENEKGWSYISSEILDELYYNHRKWVIDELISGGVVEKNNSYKAGERCIGYRITPAYQTKLLGETIFSEVFAANLERKQKLASKITAKGILVRNLRLMRIHHDAAHEYLEIKFSNSQKLLKVLHDLFGNSETLYQRYNEYLAKSGENESFYSLANEEKFGRAMVKLPDVNGKKDVYLYLSNYLNSKFNKDYLAVESIRYKEFRASVSDVNNRLDTNITNLSKVLRGCLHTTQKDQQCLFNVDIKNSQPFLLCIILIEQFKGRYMPEDVKEYIQLTSSGKLYDSIMAHFRVPASQRNVFKKKLFATVFYCKAKYTAQTKEGKYFIKMFPSVARVISELKKPLPGMTKEEAANAYKQLPIRMQRIESHMVLKVIAPKLEKAGIFFQTVHDSFICYRKDALLVKDIVVASFQEEHSLTPSVDVEELVEPIADAKTEYEINKYLSYNFNI
ncbi:hypothetical protein [uncultured Pontibacter sp.]|uniref:hypothetical protein n=1 Tax=uncultured Pontibacter sp. TaxID=453356 RepID=UPI002620493D|nr:hypothetical protein [uncultured Pontibacter sp.]